MAKAERDPRAWVLESVWKAGSRRAMTPKQARKAINEAYLCGFTPMQKKAYHASATKEDEASASTLKEEFTKIQMSTLPADVVDMTEPSEKEWCEALLRNTARYKCLREMAKLLFFFCGPTDLEKQEMLKNYKLAKLYKLLDK